MGNASIKGKGRMYWRVVHPFRGDEGYVYANTRAEAYERIRERFGQRAKLEESSTGAALVIWPSKWFTWMSDSKNAILMVREDPTRNPLVKD